jgi:ribosomal protein S20
MLQRMLLVRLEAIRSKVRTGERDFIVECTELAFIQDLISEIDNHKKRGVIAARKLGDLT